MDNANDKYEYIQDIIKAGAIIPCHIEVGQTVIIATLMLYGPGIELPIVDVKDTSVPYKEFDFDIGLGRRGVLWFVDPDSEEAGYVYICTSYGIKATRKMP